MSPHTIETNPFAPAFPKMDVEDKEAKEAARRHAANKRAIKPFTEKLLEATGPHNAAWLAWYRALRICVDGKKDDLADALCQAYYHLRDKLQEARLQAAKAVAKTQTKAGMKRAREGEVVLLPVAVSSLTASSVDLGFQSLAFAVVRVYWDTSVAACSLLRGVNMEIYRWERVNCLAIAGMPGVNVNTTNLHRLTELLMCGVAKYADSLFGTLPDDLALPAGHLDYFLLENQKGGGSKFGSNVKTYAASHILQACCMLQYATKGLPACPIIEFVSSSKKTQDTDVEALLEDLTIEKAPPTKRAKKGLAAEIKPVHLPLDANASASVCAGAGAGAGVGPVAGELWRAPFAIGTEGIKWKAGRNPDAKKREAEAKRAAVKKAKKVAATLDEEF